MNYRTQLKRGLKRRDFFHSEINYVAKHDKYLLSNMNEMSKIVIKLGSFDKNNSMVLVAKTPEDKKILKRFSYLGYKVSVDDDSAMAVAFPINSLEFKHRHAQVVSYFE